MSQSLYQDETFANYWNERSGEQGEPYKRFILDPLLFELAGNLRDKVVLEMGCGNGYLAPTFLAQNPAAVILADISAHNLRHAAKKGQDPRLSFLGMDATQPWSVQDASLDVVYSSMMLNEVEDIRSVIRNVYQALKPGGIFAFSVTHPSWDLYTFASQQAGYDPGKIRGAHGYFRRGPATFLMGSDSIDDPAIQEKYGGQSFEVAHYQRPLSDYFTQLVDAGFVVNRLCEPELTEELLRHSPRYANYAAHPVGLAFGCTKPLV